MSKTKKIITGCICALLAVIITVIGAAALLWHNEISSIMSFHEIRARNDEHRDGAVYEMDVKGGFYLEKFIEQGGVKNDSELIAFILKNITKGIIPISIEAPEIGCSSFTAHSADGDMLFARNYDMTATNTCIVRTHGSGDRHSTISTVDLSYIGIPVDRNVGGLMDKLTCLAAVYTPLDGINDAGVACGIYMSYQGPGGGATATNQNTELPDFTSTTFLRLVLDYADNLDEAVEIAKSYDMHDSARTSFHYMVADASGRSAVFEWIGTSDADDTDGSARELVITYNDADSALGEQEAASEHQWVTNFIINPGYYSNEEDMKGRDRYLKLGETVTECGGIVADGYEAMDILGVVGQRTWNQGKGAITVHSAVFNLSDLSLIWVPNENYSDPTAWFEYSLK